ncbi:MAG: cation:proton antiporter subunit C [Firmicutes bacterium]|nr:cation:proton antiporter subunit C [Bacillota bacterium]
MEWLNGETVSILLFFIGIYGIIARRNIVKTVISIGIMQTAVILFFITINYKEGSVPPIGNVTQSNIADPIPQALMITAIVIGVAVTAVSLTMFITLYHKYGTTNWAKMTKRRMDQEND